MQKIIQFAAMLILNLAAASVLAAGLLPTPVLTNVQVQSSVATDPVGGYKYAYSIKNAVQNTGKIYNIKIDITTSFPARLQVPGYGLSLSIGGNRYDFDTQLAEVRTYPVWGGLLPALVPVGTNTPLDWDSGIGVDGMVAFGSGDNTLIMPGTSLGGFELQSPGLPMIRDIQIVPWWVMEVEDHDTVTQTDKEDAGQIEQDIVYKTVTLGPSGFGENPGSFEHWNQLRDDLARAVALGWFPDAAFAAEVSAELASAREALDLHDFYLVHQRLQLLIDTLSNAEPGKMTEEAYALVYYNAQAINQATDRNPTEPTLVLSPASAAYALGGSHTQNVTVLDLGNGKAPLAKMRVNFRVDGGPQAGTVNIDSVTDANGNASATYVGTQQGIDKLVVKVMFCGGECSKEAGVAVRWIGGADLIVPFFTPPMLITEAGKPFFLSEGTKNIGNVASPASITRYYIFPNQTTDLSAAQLIGERQVPALQPGERSQLLNQVFTVPANIPPGSHFFAACADVDNAVVELDETNNCTYNPLKNYVNAAIALPPPSNRAPLCTAAQAVISYGQKKERKTATIAVAGVTDPDGDSVSIKITAVSGGASSKETHKKQALPTGIGSSAIQVATSGDDDDGGAYTLTFTASDGKGGACSGQVIATLGKTHTDDDEKDDERTHGDEKSHDKKSS